MAADGSQEDGRIMVGCYAPAKQSSACEPSAEDERDHVVPLHGHAWELGAEDEEDGGSWGTMQTKAESTSKDVEIHGHRRPTHTASGDDDTQESSRCGVSCTACRRR